MCIGINYPEPPYHLQLYQKTEVNTELPVQGDSSIRLPDKPDPWNLHYLRLPQLDKIRVHICNSAT